MPAVTAPSRIQVAPIPIEWHTGLPVYASERFLQAAGDDWGWVGGSDDLGRLRCFLPFTVIRKAGMRLVRFRAQTVPLAGELDIAEEQSFLDGVVTYFRSCGAHGIVPSSNNAIFRTYPAGATAAPYGTVINHLDQSEEALWKGVSKTCRNDIRRAMRNGVEIKSGLEYVESAYQLIAETLKRSGMSFRSLADFRKLIASLGENVRVFVAIHEGAIQAASLAPFSGHSAYTLYGGTRANPAHGAMHLLHWEAMREFQRLGVRQFDFSGVRINPEKGSKQEGLLNFKTRFGGEVVQGYMWKYSFRWMPFAAYNVAVRLLKGGDVVDNEGHKLGATARSE
jgi:hypothetical protein